MMRRRQFLTFLGVTAAAWPPIADAQQAAAPLVGFLGDGSPETMALRVAAFRQGLNEVGYVEGRNLAIDWRSVEHQQPNRLRALAADLVARRVAVIVTTTDPATLAAKAATSTIPIVFLSAGDPVKSGLPGGNVTGLSWFGADLAPARLGLLHQLVPKAAVIGLLMDHNLTDAASQVREVEAAASTTGLKLVVLHAGSASDIDGVFTTLAAQQVGALVVGASAFFISQREQLIELAARHAIPAIYAASELTADGGLASYGHSMLDAFRRAGVYTGWILQGAIAAALPVLQSSKFELVINLRTAKTLGLDVPPNLLAGADQVIQ